MTSPMDESPLLRKNREGRKVSGPNGAWPQEMRAATAAAYCDEPSVEAFMAKVDRGIYSSPVRAKGCQPKWHRFKLDRDIARRHGLQPECVVIPENLEDLI